ncbi:ETS homologous factor isoform X9 [Ixodes scapularis]|uniref:ETS homologous factor isoform X9 n=1 Tax=Ixodes scapularis TaxID=6945 RepID=UPI001A9CDE35|nr:ETS homologous factor isoform X9 [Ixodes scapularis]
MMVNQTDLMAPHESPYSTEEQFMYEPTEEDKNAYCNLQPIGLDTSDHVTPCLQHTMDLMPPSRPIPFEGDPFPSDVLDLEGDRWQRIPIQHWQSCDVLTWLLSWLGHNQIELAEEEIDVFSNMAGDHLCRLSPEEFRNIAPSYGHMLYEEVQRHLGSGSAARNVTGLSEPFYDPEKYGSFQHFFDPLEIPNSSPGSENGKGMGKLWEFIRDLLLNPTTNPSLIRWERREDGIFKFVQSDKVAKMWGDRKQNPRMTYEKLSRAMRTYYGKQILEPVPKTEGLPKKLVYKFGPRAGGWFRSASRDYHPSSYPRLHRAGTKCFY